MIGLQVHCSLVRLFLLEKDLRRWLFIRADLRMKLIPLRNNKGQVVKEPQVSVSDEDYDWLNKYKWCQKKANAVTKNIYAQSTIYEEIDGQKVRKNILMHVVIMEKISGPPPEGHIVDHSDHNTLNNTRDNLSYKDRKANNQNKIKKQGTTSKYVGVSFYKDRKKWTPACQGKKLGTFDTEEEAAKVYDMYVLKVLGPTAKTNGLAKYEDVQNMKLEDIVKTNAVFLPKYISMNKKYYVVNITYKEIKYQYTTAASLEAAKAKLEEFMKIIEQRKIEDSKIDEITRNSDGQAIIKIKNFDILVDDDKWHKLMEYKWRADGNGYCITDMNATTIAMHKYLLEAPKDMIIDHANGIRHDNRMCNLRVIDPSGNSHNRIKIAGTTSKYRGVSNKGNRYYAKITRKGIIYKLGSYNDEMMAGLAYNIASSLLYGDFASPNTLEDDFVNNNYDAILEIVKPIIES